MGIEKPSQDVLKFAALLTAVRIRFPDALEVLLELSTSGLEQLGHSHFRHRTSSLARR
jgi:hypothetical protein